MEPNVFGHRWDHSAAGAGDFQNPRFQATHMTTNEKPIMYDIVAVKVAENPIP